MFSRKTKMNLPYIIFGHFVHLHLIIIKFRTPNMNCNFKTWGEKAGGELVGGKGPGFKRPWGEKAGVQKAGGE